MPGFVNPVYPHSPYDKKPLYFKRLKDFLNVTSKQNALLKCQVPLHNFVHKLKMDAAAALFNNPVSCPVSSTGRLLPLRTADAVNCFHHHFHCLRRRELRNAMAEV